MLPRRLLPWLFALTLLLGQAAAFAHALSHVRAHDSALPDKVCEVCVAQAQLGSAMPASVVVLALPAAIPSVAPALGEARAQSAPLPACARAPPSSSAI